MSKKQGHKGVPPSGSRVARVPSAKKPTPAGRSTRSRKYIVAQWFDTPHDPFYDRTMYVIESDHPRFVSKSRFDFGFMTIAGKDGYTVELRPALAARSSAKQSPRSGTERKRATKGSGGKAATPKRK